MRPSQVHDPCQERRSRRRREDIHMPYRTLTVRQQAQIWVGGPELGQPELLFETHTMLIEAPNWSLDGAFLFVNGHGGLWRLDVGSPERVARVEFEGLPELNND